MLVRLMVIAIRDDEGKHDDEDHAFAIAIVESSGDNADDGASGADNDNDDHDEG